MTALIKNVVVLLLIIIWGTSLTLADVRVIEEDQLALQKRTRKAIVNNHFDGVWHDSNTVMIIKEFPDGNAIMQGKDGDGSWQGQGMIVADTMKCFGKGRSESAGSFIYESTLTLQSNFAAKEEWKVWYPNDHRKEGSNTFTRQKLLPVGSLTR